MVDPKLETLLRQDTEAWNEWRRANPSVHPDISNADLSGANLTGTDLSGATLDSATKFNGSVTQGCTIERFQLEQLANYGGSLSATE